MIQIKLKDIIGQGYTEFWRFKGRYLICKGSRGSKKSTTAALKIIYNMMKYPLSNTLVVRQVFNTQRDSTYKQLIKATEMLGVRDKWTFTLSPLEATYKETGQKIYFRGCDNPDSITSITVSTGYLNFVWFEEAYQINKEQDFDKIDLSIRGKMPDGYYPQIILTFNPWNEHHWIKKRFFDTPNTDNKLAMTTNYLCNEFLADSDIAIFEEMKVRYPRRYQIEALGEWGVSEGLIFDNYVVRDFEPTDLDLPLYLGLDFGWHDPTAISVMKIDDKQKIIYLCEEFYKSEQTLKDVANWLKNRGYAKSLIYCDSSEPRSYVELQSLGIISIKQAKKGQGSVMEGIRKLQEYEIVIHPKCENAQVEFSNYSFDKDKAGQWIDKPIDSYNHLIDSMRYGIQGITYRKEIRTINKNMFGL